MINANSARPTTPQVTFFQVVSVARLASGPALAATVAIAERALAQNAPAVAPTRLPSGVPFALTCVGNVVLLGAFALEAKSRLPRRGGIGVSVWRFLLPQTTAAIFLAAFSSIPSDERWSLTVKGNLPVAVITWAVFLVVGFVFIREIILGNQFRGRGERSLRNRRTAQIMSLSLWQAFVLAMFFTMTVGRIMGAGDRGNIDPEAFVGMGRWIRQLLPIEVHLGSWFLEPATSRETAIFWVHPRAIVSWTIQMFFFGAIFERIMGRSEA